MAKAIFRQPLALLLAWSLLPIQLPFIGRVSPVQEAKAQVTVCSPTPTASQIIQTLCTVFESQAVNDYLTAHQIPLTDAPLIYQYGRSDLRSELRAFMLTEVIGLIQKQPWERALGEQQVYYWLGQQVWQHEKDLYQTALDDRNSWAANPCAWRPDPDVANQYGLVYPAVEYCAGTGLAALASHPAGPSRSYFMAAALKNTYGKILGGTPRGAEILGLTAAYLGATIGLGAGAAASFPTFLAFYSAAGALFPESIGFSGTIAANTAVDTAGLSASVVATGPALIVLIALAVGTLAAFESVYSNQVEVERQQMDALNNSAHANPPDLVSFTKDRIGLYKLAATWTEATVPEFSSSVALPPHGAHDPIFNITQNGSTQSSSQVTFKDWKGAVWTASTSGGWFVQTCAGGNCTQSDSFSPTFRIVDWNNVQWRASRTGGNFVLTQNTTDTSKKLCSADNRTGLSNPTDPYACSSYVTDKLNLVDGSGNKVTVALSQPPAFTSPSMFAFTMGAAKSVAISATSIPAANFSLNSTLPAGFGLTDGGTPGTVNLAFTGAGTPGTYTVDLIASNTSQTVHQSITVIVGTTVQITSPASAAFKAGAFGSFLVTASGYPAPKIDFNNFLPTGLSLLDHGDGTATISGTVALLHVDPLCSASIGFTATNTSGTAFQPFCFNIQDPVDPPITTPTTANFIAGVSNRFLIRTAPADLPISIGLGCTVPSMPWLGLTDNGDGTAVLTGAPPAGSTSGGTATVRAYATGSFPLICGMDANTLQPVPLAGVPITINVVGAPVFTTPASATFQTGQAGSFEARTNNIVAAISTVGNPPAGLGFGGDIGGLTISGTPADGTGGEYDYLFRTTVGGASAQQPFRLLVYEPPKIVSPNTFNFTIGVPNSVFLETTGFPKTQTPDHQGMVAASAGGFPAGVALQEVVQYGQHTGTWTISGTPTGVGPSSTIVSMRNGVGDPAAQFITIRVIIPGDINADGSVNCSDVQMVKAAMGTRLGMSGYSNLADANGDGVIDLRDLAYVSAKMPAGTRCN